MKVVTIVGARPQFIKAAPVSRVLRKEAKEILIHTGQHYDQSMSDVFFEELKIPIPDQNLHVGSKLHGEQTGEMLKKVEEVLVTEKPDAVLVYGDTNSTLAGSLVAAKLHIPVAHVEAGLRSFNKRMPEELNRIITDHVSRWLFCPTPVAVENLNNEGIKQGVHLVGDVMFDSIVFNRELATQQSTILEELQLAKKDYLLATIHRAENTDDLERFKNIVEALNQLTDLTVFPIHPRTKHKLTEYGLELKNPNLKLIPPVGYLDMLQLEAHAKKILTDSGGVQKEAFILHVPCITLRDETEWIETVELKANRLVGADKEKILEAVNEFEVDFSSVTPVYGQGDTAEKIVRQLIHDIKG